MDNSKNRPKVIQDIVEAVLDSPAETSSELRQALEARTASLSAAQREPVDLPAELADYVKKLSERPHEIEDEDIDALIAAGYSDDQIFEITISAALGDALARFEKGFELVKGLST